MQEIGIYSQASACFQPAGNIPLLPVVIPPGYLARHVYGLQVRMFPACLGNLWQPNHKFPSIQDQNHFTSIVKNCQISWNSSGFHKIPSGICGCRFVQLQEISYNSDPLLAFDSPASKHHVEGQEGLDMK